MLPIDQLDELALSPLSPLYKLPTEMVVYSPQWDPNNRWIYYWRSPFYGPDSDFYDIVLMRIEVGNGSIEEVLSKTELIDILGSDTYFKLGWTYGIPPDWRISPDGNQALLAIYEFRNEPGALWLFELDG